MTNTQKKIANAREDLEVPTALRKHLDIVERCAGVILEGLAKRFPELSFDREAVFFGAATHDLGKALHLDELSKPGKKHEAAGYRWLRARGFPDRLARFARTHGAPIDDRLSLEDLLVMLADKLWKGRRVEALESSLIARIAVAEGVERWEVFQALDAIADAAYVGVEAS